MNASGTLLGADDFTQHLAPVGGSLELSALVALLPLVVVFVLLVSANTTGGVVGKMISPQNLTIAASATGLDGQESAILRKVLPWSLGLLLLLCLLVFAQSTPVLDWMLP